MCEMLLKVNNFAADIGKSLWSFHKCRDGRFIRLCQISHDLFSNEFFRQYFNTTLFYKSFGRRCKSDVIQ